MLVLICGLLIDSLEHNLRNRGNPAHLFHAHLVHDIEQPFIKCTV